MSNQQLSIKSYFEQDNVSAKFRELLGKRAPQFITSVLQVVNSNKLLATADPKSVYGAAAAAAVLDLPINNNLGFAYIVPYNERQPDGSKKQVAQFQLGYKGFIQLAQRSGQFQTLSAAPVYEGQLISQNPLSGYVFDFTKKTSDVVIGYAAYFRLINGFEKVHYMDIAELKKHGAKYSKTFGNSNGLWNTDFDAMAQKTVLKLLLAKFAPLSIEMQKAVIADQGKINDIETNDVEYVDNTEVQIDKESERVRLMIEAAKTPQDLELLEETASQYGQSELFNQRKSQLAA